MIRMEDFDEEQPFEDQGVFDRVKDTVNDPEFRAQTRTWAKGSLFAAVMAAIAFTMRFIGELGNSEGGVN